MRKYVLFVFFIFQSVFTVNAQSISLKDSLLQLLKKLPNDTNRVIVLNELGFEYRHTKPDSTYILAQQAVELAQKLKFLGGEARALGTKAAAFKFLGDYAKSLKMYNQAFELNSKLGDDYRKTVILNNKADLFMQQGDWPKALKTMKECFVIYNTLPNPPAGSKPVYFSNMGECFLNLNQLDSAKFYFTQALPLAEATKESILTTIYYLLGDMALAENNLKQAYSFYKKSISNAVTENRFSDLFESSIRMAKLFQKTKKSDSALYFAKQSLVFAQKGAYLGGILKSSEYLAKLYKGKNDTEALKYYTIAVTAKDSLYSQDKVRQLLSINFEEKEKAQQIEAENILNKNKIRLSILIGIITIMIGIALILYKNNKQKQQANKILKDKNEEIEETVAQLKATQVSLRAKNAENELLLKEIHHRVKNNLEVVASLIALQSAKINDPEIQDAMLASQNRVQSMGILHQKLYQSEHLGFIEMKNYFQNLSENILDSYNQTDRIEVDINMEEIELDVDTAVSVGLIINELLTNSLKYAFPNEKKGNIKLSLENLDKDNLSLKISDNGIGKSPNTKTIGTGFGTQLVELLTRQIEGSFHEKNDNGTMISINFKRQKAT
ncbi:tetratricopeptide repeat-containing sensor histidine kinase [Emticicia sp. SJ17W-69]|uniref:tetratricopeptide repeat-containing sensor histidine kinase n=1 Tax=Emticicia sp. SJ17W-69 TaxID=3421657 RepID=UPI003EC0CE49